MKKWIGILIVVLLLGGGWYLARTYWRITPPWDMPKLDKVTRGDIKVPITAAGLIEPLEKIEIKSKASGEVIEIKVKQGDFVKVGDVLVELKKEDEQRARDRAQAGLDRAKALLAQAKVDVLKAELAVKQSDARLIQLKAAARVSYEDWNHKTNKVSAEFRAANLELMTLEAKKDSDAAAVSEGEATLEVSKDNIDTAKETVKIQEAAVAQAQKELEDANERLNETTIRARQDALVTDVKVERGMLVQSGTSGFTGGTLVLTLANVEELKVIARVDEADYGRVVAISPVDALPDMPSQRERAAEDAAMLARRTGKVKVTVDAFPEESFEGAIERVEPQGKLNSGATIIQFDVHVRLTDPKRFMLPLGAQGQVEFTVESVKDALVVPADAVKTNQSQRGIWIKPVGPAKAGENYPKKFIPCRFGITDGSVTQVIEALGDEKIEVGMEVYTKLPKDRKDDDE